MLGINIGDDSGTDKTNTFDNIGTGMTINQGSATIYNNYFCHMPYYSTAIPGAGIIASGLGNGSGHYHITIGGLVNYQSNIFADVYNPIAVNYAQTIKIENNKITNTVTNPISGSTSGFGLVGIKVLPSNQLAVVNINNNKILDCKTGILVSRVGYGLDATEITVDGNNITSSNALGTSTTQYCQYGIDLEDAQSNSSSMAPDKYKVSNNTIKETFTCIVASYVLKGLIIYNNPDLEVHFANAAGAPISGCGIKLQTCDNARVYNNIITSGYTQVATESGLRYKGINVTTSQNCQVMCNDVSNISESITFNGNCNLATPVLLRNNTMSTGINGLALRVSGTTPGQIGNQLTSGSADPIGLMWNTASGGGFPTFTAQTYTDAVTNTTNTLSKLYLDNTTGPLNLSGSTSPAVLVPGLYKSVPILNSDPFNASYAYTLGTGLNYATTLNAYNCQGVPVALIANGGGNEKSLEGALNAQDLLAMISDTAQATTMEDVQRYQKKMMAYTILDTTTLALSDSSGVLQHFYDSTKVAALGQLTDVDKALAINDYATATSINSAVVPNNAVEDNKKMVNYYGLLKINDTAYEYSSADSAAIYNIAVQCPSEGGNIIWQARVMYYQMIGYRVDFEEHCAEMGKNALHTASETTYFKLYPNPNNGNFTFEYHIGENQTGVISIYDIAGKLIRSYNFNSTTSTATINASELQAGVYMYDVLISNTKVKTDKLIIIK